MFAFRRIDAPSRVVLFLMIIGSTWVYFWSQYFIGSVTPPECHVADLAQMWTAPINVFLHEHPSWADGILAMRALLCDATVLFLLILAIWRSTARPAIPLLVFLILRQLLQSSTSLPIASGMIWHDPGVPSLFSIYGINSDLYFSASVGIAVLGALELARFHRLWLTVLGFAAAFAQGFFDLALRSHYITDIYTSIVTAVAVSMLVHHIAPAIDRFIGKWRTVLMGLILFCVGAFFATQSLIAQKPIPECGIVDALHNLFLPINEYLRINQQLGNACLIFMNTALDALTVFVMVLTLWKRNVRPFLCLALFMVLRQSLQMLVALPIPPCVIWSYPGVPSLLQTYEVINDFYFSGHTGASLIAAIELARLGRLWLSIVGYAIFAIEASGVIILQMHYTMDVYTALVTVCCVEALAVRMAPRINRFLTFRKA